MSFQAEIVRNQDRVAQSSISRTEAAMDLATWETTLVAELDAAAPKDHAQVTADAIREAVRLCRAGVFEREATTDVLVSTARIFALTIPEIEKACMRSKGSKRVELRLLD